jgi:hypothetical protein
MEHIKHCAVVVRRPEDVWEGTRTTLGLAAHNYWAYLFLLDTRVEVTEALKENLQWLEEMECETVSNMAENVGLGFRLLETEQIARELKKMDLVIPFGKR